LNRWPTKPLHAIALNSCTAALHLAAVCLNLKPGDEVIVPALTFCATANAVIHAGGTPVFADVDPVRLCVSAATIEKALTPKTKAIVVVHFAGRSAPMDEIMALADQRGIRVIEDAAHAIETRWNDRHVGTYGWASCFSFYATKNVSTGEGGMLLTRDEELASLVRKLSLHGMSKDAHKRFTTPGFHHQSYDYVGFKYNMPDLAAALGIHSLKKVESNYALRKNIWEIYMNELRDLPLTLPPSAEFRENAHDWHALHLFQIRVKAALRDKLLSAFSAENIGVGVHYPALTTMPLYEKYLKPGQTFKEAEIFSAETISLPIGTAMTEADAHDVVRAAKKILSFYC